MRGPLNKRQPRGDHKEIQRALRFVTSLGKMFCGINLSFVGLRYFMKGKSIRGVSFKYVGVGKIRMEDLLCY